MDLVTTHEPLDTLCHWLVHRDRESWEDWRESHTSPWAKRGEYTGIRSVVSGANGDERPIVDAAVADVLRQLFAVDEQEAWRRRDSRWLHPAWELVVKNLPGIEKGVGVPRPLFQSAICLPNDSRRVSR